jgi:uncharacterized protein with NRDE domain
MCFVLVLLGVHPDYPLVVAANRDEARDRPSRGPHAWPGEPGIRAGRDEVSGGTWLGVNGPGMVVAITNRRDGAVDPARRSRGLFCLEVLRQRDPAAALGSAKAALEHESYNPFNLLCASVSGGWTLTAAGDARELRPGTHVVTNRGDPDDETLAITVRARELLEGRNLHSLALFQLLTVLGRVCSDEGGTEPICRPSGPRGTVSSSLIAVEPSGRTAAYWHAEGPPSREPYVALQLG